MSVYVDVCMSQTEGESERSCRKIDFDISCGNIIFTDRQVSFKMSFINIANKSNFSVQTNQIIYFFNPLDGADQQKTVAYFIYFNLRKHVSFYSIFVDLFNSSLLFCTSCIITVKIPVTVC